MLLWLIMAFLTHFILICTSALGLSIALPNDFFPLGIPLGGFLCLAPYFYALKTADSWKKGAAMGFVFGIVFHSTSSWWLANFKDYAFWTLGATSLFYGFFFGFWGIFLQYAKNYSKSTPGRQKIPRFFSGPFLTALIWTVMEWQKSNGYFAFPWGLLPYTVYNCLPLIQIADITGVYGLSFLLALSSAVIAEIPWIRPKNKKITTEFHGENRDKPKRQNGFLTSCFSVVKYSYSVKSIFAVLAILALFLVYGCIRLAHPVPAQRTIPLILVQHNIDQYYYEEEALTRAVSLSRQGLEAMREQGKEPAMIIWSETVLTLPYKGNRFFRSQNAIPFFYESDIPILTGAPLIIEEGQNEDSTDIYNGAILVQRGSVISGYAKQQLIPFAESIPFGSQPWMRRFMDKFVGFSSGWATGKEAVIMEIQGLSFGTPICFEDAFARLCRNFTAAGAEVLINLTNDSWSQSVSAEVQHLAAARFRSVENRRPLVRSTNSGCTVYIDAEGRIRSSLPLFTADYLILDLPVQTGGPTVYFLFGDWFPVLCGILALLWFIYQSLGLNPSGISIFTVSPD